MGLLHHIKTFIYPAHLYLIRSDGHTSSLEIVEKGPHSALKMIDINESCWNCGINKATQLLYGYPICDKCAKEGIDPEDMEEVVIESLDKSHIIPLDEIDLY